MAWSSSTTSVVPVGRSDVGDRLRPARRHRHAGRVLRPRLEDHRGRLRRRRRTARSWSTSRPSSSTSTPIDVARQPLEQVEHRREPGVLDDHTIAEAQGHAGHPVEGVEGAVDDRDRLRRERPRRPQLVLQRREHRVVEVARRQRLPADLGDDRGEVRQQLRVGRARGQVEGEVARALADLAVAARPARAGRVADERAVAAASLDRADVGEAAPCLRDGRRRDAEAARELADRRQPRRRPPAIPDEIIRPIVAAMRRAVRPSSPTSSTVGSTVRRRRRRPRRSASSSP